MVGSNGEATDITRVAGIYKRRVSFFSDSAAGVAKPDRQLVVDQLAAATGENRRSIGQARTVLLADGGREPSDQAALGGDGRKDRRLAGADGVDAGDGRSEIRRPGGEGRRRICGMCWKDRISRFWILPPGRQPRLAGAKTAPGGQWNSHHRRLAAGCILSRVPESKMEIRAPG